jgi:hypothetical protein
MNTGVKLTLATQLAFAGIVAPLHVSALITNSGALVPETVTAPGPKTKLAFPLFVTIMDCAMLGVFTGWLAKTMLKDETVTAGAGALGFNWKTVPSCKLPPTAVVPYRFPILSMTKGPVGFSPSPRAPKLCSNTFA